MNAELHLLDNAHTGRPRPGTHPPVTIIGPAIPGFLMHADGGHAMAGAQCGQYLHSITNPKHQTLPERCQLAVKLAKTFGQKIIVTPRHVGLPPQVGLKDIERDHRPGHRRRDQGGVVMRAKVTLEPDNLHHVPLLYLPESR